MRSPETTEGEEDGAGHPLVEEHFGSASQERDLAALGEALTASPPRIPTKYLYDKTGSELFEAITELEVYYQTRTERALLHRIAPRLIAEVAPQELVELGSGAATKTRVLLSAMYDVGQLEKYVPFDISSSVVHRTAVELRQEYPGVSIHGMIGDFVHDLDHLPEGRRRLIVFLGGTIGNFDDAGARRFLRRISQASDEQDRLLIGFDLIKDPNRIEAAYNDPQGVTAEFNRNILRVVNAAADGNFAPESFTHRAPYNRERHRIEMWLRAETDQTVRLTAVPLDLHLAAGTEILTEISTKYDRDLATSLLADSGFHLETWFEDDEALFALALARRA